MEGSVESCWVPDRAGAGSGCMDPGAVSILSFDLGGGERSWRRLTLQRTEFPELSERGGPVLRQSLERK